MIVVKKGEIIGIIAGILILIGSGVAFYFEETNLFYFLAGSGILTGVFPFVLRSVIEGRREREKDEMFLEFSRSLVESVESGTPISKGIINMRLKDFGTLTPHVTKLANQIELGIPLQQALETFAYDTKSKVIIRAITLIREADKTGGNINSILESVAKSVSEIEKLKAERRAAISSIVVEGYIIFFVFIVIMIVMEVQIIPLTSGISGISPGTSALPSSGLGDVLGTGFDSSEFTFAFLGLLVTQGLFAGLVIGKLAEGNIKSGIKHSFIMISMAVLLSTGSKLVLQG